ncbi:single-stranded DNA-binding protein [Olegusella massiliensis]|uniref:single-stranded DNA-binding protein n=1 Tax=Olegusella massiliensis TaxID=1776381 RepID=UPI0008380887|nr:single-stranded DNA-binding protein [Olegusella massiliensis]
MSDINTVVLTGNLTRDAELMATNGGASVLKFGIASNRSVKGANGEWEDVPNFIDCTIFGARAQSLSSILAKGMKVTIEGELRYSSWTDKDGNKRSKLEVVCQNIVLPPRKSQPASAQPYAQSKPAPAQQTQAHQQQQTPNYAPAPAYNAPQQAPAPDVYDEDIPF